MDNGWTVGLDIAYSNAGTYSNTNVSVTVPALGAFRISQGVSGSGIDRMDDKTPNVWEEAYASGLSTGINTVAGASGGADKTSSGGSANNGSGYDVTLELGEAVTGMT